MMPSDKLRLAIIDQFYSWLGNIERPGELGYVEAAGIVDEVFKLIDIHLPRLQKPFDREMVDKVLKEQCQRCRRAEYEADYTLNALERLYSGVSEGKQVASFACGGCMEGIGSKRCLTCKNYSITPDPRMSPGGESGGKCAHPNCSITPHQPFCMENCRKWKPCPPAIPSDAQTVIGMLTR